MIIIFCIILVVVLIYFFEKEKKWLWFQIREMRSIVDGLSLHSQFDPSRDVVLPPTFTSNVAPKILILKLDHIGDIVLTIPALRAVRQTWPAAEITLAAGGWAESLLSQEGLIDVFVVSNILQKSLSKKEKKESLREFRQVVKGKTFDIALDLRVFGDTAYLLEFVQSPVKVFSRTLVSQSVSGFGVSVPPFLHVCDKILYLCQKIGCVSIPRQPNLILGENEVIVAKKYIESLKAGDVVIGIHPFASVKTRNWGPSNYVAVAQALIAQVNATCLFFLGSEDFKEVDSLPSEIKRKIHVVRGKTLRESASIIALCDIFVCNNSGPMHIAAAVGTKVVGVFSGVEMAWEWGPVAKDVAIVCVDLPCIRCHQSECSHMTCLTSIPVNKVVQVVLQNLPNSPHHLPLSPSF